MPLTDLLLDMLRCPRHVQFLKELVEEVAQECRGAVCSNVSRMGVEICDHSRRRASDCVEVAVDAAIRNYRLDPIIRPQVTAQVTRRLVDLLVEDLARAEASRNEEEIAA